jgi:DnaJ family protein B protein 12
VISKAFDTLSDNQKRAIHDSGGDRIRHTSGGANYRSYNRQQYYQQQQQDDFLNMFFGNNVNRRNAYDRRRRPTTSETENMTPLIPIILVAFLFLFSILFSFDSEPMYSFRPSQTHTNARFTKTNNIKYYAQPQFETTVKANQFKFKSIERQIESDWLSEVRFQCQREQRRRADLLTRAEGFLWGAGRDQKLYKQAEEMKMPNCDEARRLMTRIH